MEHRDQTPSPLPSGVLLIDQSEKTFQLLPPIDRLTKLASLDERSSWLESSSKQQIADVLQLVPVSGGEPKLEASMKPALARLRQTLLGWRAHVSVAAEQRRQLLGHGISTL